MGGTGWPKCPYDEGGGGPYLNSSLSIRVLGRDRGGKPSRDGPQSVFMFFKLLMRNSSSFMLMPDDTFGCGMGGNLRFSPSSEVAE